MSKVDDEKVAKEVSVSDAAENLPLMLTRTEAQQYGERMFLQGIEHGRTKMKDIVLAALHYQRTYGIPEEDIDAFLRDNGLFTPAPEKQRVELKPCPFCGNPPVTSATGEGQRGLMIECLSEGCVNPHLSYYDHATAIKLWNHRISKEKD